MDGHAMPHRLMNFYDNLPTNWLLSGGNTAIFAFALTFDYKTSVVLFLISMIFGKGVDVAIQIWKEKRKNDRNPS